MTFDESDHPLDYAASLLDSVGSDFARVPADVALDCLYAADLLEQAGGRAASAPLVDDDPRVTLRAAMTALFRAGDAAFASPTVVEAARVARQALRRLS